MVFAITLQHTHKRFKFALSQVSLIIVVFLHARRIAIEQSDITSCKGKIETNGSLKLDFFYIYEKYNAFTPRTSLERIERYRETGCC